ncbi:MAG: MFS transporter [Actinomycetales bacterium]|nr:MFS transporter [Actinomycetales bacterium]
MSPPSRRSGPSVPRQIWVLIVAAFAIAIGFGIVSPVLPQYAHSFSVSVTATAVVVSAFAAFRLLWATPAGALVGRFGERPVYMTGVLVVAASSAATAFAQSYWQLLAFRSLGGIGSVMFTVSAMGLLVRLAPPTIRGRVSALYGATFLLGSIAGPVVGGLLAQFGMRVPFLVYSGTLVVAAVLIGVLLEDPRQTQETGRPTVEPMTVREAFADPAYRAVVTSGFANGWSNFGVRVAMVPLFAAVVVSPEPWVAGAVMAVFAIGNAGILPFASRIADGVGRRPLVIAGTLVNGAFTAMIGLSASVAALLVVSLLAGAGGGLLGPGQQAAVADVIGSERSAGKVLAVFQMIQDVGAIVGPVIVGLIADRVGYGAAFAVTGALMMAASLPWFRSPETLERVRALHPQT